MKPKAKVWVAFNEDVKFGEGRARLLELIDKHGSLQQAAKELEMSYRNAWGYLGQLERAAGFKFVQRVPGGGPHGGMRLTPEAERFLACYRTFRDGLDRAVKTNFERAFRR
jgi:molybdate transport system regulatory protein